MLAKLDDGSSDFTKQIADSGGESFQHSIRGLVGHLWILKFNPPSLFSNKIWIWQDEISIKFDLRGLLLRNSWDICVKIYCWFAAWVQYYYVLKRPFFFLVEGLATLERLCSHENANINRAACSVIQKHFSSSTAILTAWADDIKTRTSQQRIWDYSSIILG